MFMFIICCFIVYFYFLYFTFIFIYYFLFYILFLYFIFIFMFYVCIYCDVRTEYLYKVQVNFRLQRVNEYNINLNLLMLTPE